MKVIFMDISKIEASKIHIFLKDHRRRWLCYKPFFFKGLENELDSVLASAGGNSNLVHPPPRSFP